MRQQKNKPTPDNSLQAWRIALWLIFFGGTLFFLPFCLDRYLAPRFFFLSGALLVSLVLVWKDLKEKGDWKLRGFDLMLLGWYGLNLASVSWAFSWSEGIFYAQKTLLLFLVYWLSRQALLRDEMIVRQTLRQIFTLSTWAVCGIIVVQVGLAFREHGLDNEQLYDFASGLFGNKSLATDFLFFLLIFNVLLYKEHQRRSDFWLEAGIVGVLILLLQTRTVYLALAVCGLLYCLGRSALDTDFRKLFLKRILPAGTVLVLLLIAFLAFKGRGNSFAERLNPSTYLESTTANERRFVWYKTDELNKDHFWLGVGNGSWKFWFPSKNIAGGYRLEEQNVVFTRAHNDYLEVRAEMGIVGVIWFCALFGFAFLAGIWSLWRLKATTEKAANKAHDLLVLSLGLLGYCIIQFFDFPRERIEMQVFLGLFFAWIMFCSRDNLLGKFGLSSISKPLMILLFGLGLAFNLIIGWYRIVGEKHNVALLDAQAAKDWKTLAAESGAAENTFYEYTDVAIPLAWHEGIAWYQLNQMEKAVSAFEKAYRLNPWSFQVINNYASALVKHQQFRASIPLYEQALRINPKFDDGKFNLSFVYLQLGDFSKSLAWLDKVDTIPNPGNEIDRQKNIQLKSKQADFRKAVYEKMK